MTIDWKALCVELAKVLAEEYGVQREFANGDPLLGSGAIELLSRVRTHLFQPEPKYPSDKELLELMPETMQDEFSYAAKVCSDATGGQVKPAIFRVALNTAALEYAQVILAHFLVEPTNHSMDNNDAKDAARYRWIKAQKNLAIRTNKTQGVPWTKVDTGERYYPSHQLDVNGTGFNGVKHFDDLIDQAMEMYPSET